MKRLFAMLFALSITTAFFAGCDKKASEVKKETTVTTPEGQTTVTDTEKVETKGENPPAAK